MMRGRLEEGRRWQTVFAVAAFCALAAAVALVIYYIVVVMWTEFTADYLDTLLWAEAAYDAKRLLNPDFAYACFLPFGGQLLMVPFIGIYGVSVTTQNIGMILFALLFAASILFLFRSMQFSWGWSAMLCAGMLLLLLGTAKLREMFFGHVIYYNLGCFFLFVGMGLFLRADRAENGPWRQRAYTALLTLWCALSALNGVFTLALFTIPLMGGTVLERLADGKGRLFADRKLLRLLGLVVLGTLVGFLAGRQLSRGMKQEYAEAVFQLSQPAAWIENLRKVPRLWHGLLFWYDGVRPHTISRIAGTLLFTFGPLGFPLVYRKLETRAERSWIWAHGCMVGVIIGLYMLLGRMGEAGWRMIPMLATAIVTELILLRHVLRRAPVVWRCFAGLACACIVGLCAVNAAVVLRQPRVSALEIWRERAAFLSAHELTYGYATFWHASPITVAADGAVAVHNISLSDGSSRIAPATYQVNRAKYADVPGQQRYFVMLDENEAAAFEREGGPERYRDILTERLSMDAFVIYVFDANPVIQSAGP